MKIKGEKKIRFFFDCHYRLKGNNLRKMTGSLIVASAVKL